MNCLSTFRGYLKVFSTFRVKKVHVQHIIYKKRKKSDKTRHDVFKLQKTIEFGRYLAPAPPNFWKKLLNSLLKEHQIQSLTLDLCMANNNRFNKFLYISSPRIFLVKIV